MKDTMTRREYLREHHPLGGSQLGRALMCPPSVREQEGLPEPPTRPATSSGTRCHRHLAGEMDVKLSEEEQGLVEKCEAWLAEKLPWINTTKTCRELHTEVIEDGEVLTAGTADLVAFRDHYAVLVDWKFGHGEMSEKNLACQLGAYALGVMRQYRVPEVSAWAYQPRYDREYHCTFNDEDMLVELIRGIVERTTDPEAPYGPSMEACRYCRALATCKAAEAETKALVARERPKPPIDPAKLGELLDMARLAEARAKEVRDLATDLAREGCQIPGYKLVSRKGSQYVAAPIGAFLKLKESLGEPETMELMDMSATKARAAYIAWHMSEKGGTKKDAALAFDLLLELELERRPDVRYLRKDGGR